MDDLLTDEHRLLVDSLRAFVEEELRPYEDETDKTGEVPPELAQRITSRALEMGFYAANLPESVGGGGLDYVSLALMEREFGKSTYGLHGFVHRPSEILMACEGDQIERYLLPCVRAEKMEFFALTEPGAGSDIMSMTTRARRDGSDWLITGGKHFISCNVEADFAIVFAVTGSDETARGERKRITAFLVDKGQEGFDIRRGPRSVAQRAYHTYQLSFDDCRVSSGQIMGKNTVDVGGASRSVASRGAVTPTTRNQGSR